MTPSHVHAPKQNRPMRSFAYKQQRSMPQCINIHAVLHVVANSSTCVFGQPRCDGTWHAELKQRSLQNEVLRFERHQRQNKTEMRNIDQQRTSHSSASTTSTQTTSTSTWHDQLEGSDQHMLWAKHSKISITKKHMNSNSGDVNQNIERGRGRGRGMETEGDDPS